MRGGNLGGDATNKPCATNSKTAVAPAAAPAATVTTTESTASTGPAPMADTSVASSSTAMGAPAKRTRVARADRN